MKSSFSTFWECPVSSTAKKERKKIFGVVGINQEYALYLASQSPRRKEMLQALGIEFTVLTGKSEEKKPGEGVRPEEYTSDLARAKACAVLDLLPKSPKKQLVLAADTVVVTERGHILGKPKDADDALAMLESLCGRTHTVTTAVSVLSKENPELSFTFADTCTVRFGSFSREILACYVATGEPMDKAGAYAVQGQGAFLVKSLAGSWTTVVGLPLEQLAAKLCALEILLPRTNKKA
ncbi:MAG: septum formation protein Maf [Desulfovibrionaceae bacterium]|nr:septum formation protein Maf [Desulfovibrionaceae bacterium]